MARLNPSIGAGCEEILTRSIGVAGKYSDIENGVEGGEPRTKASDADQDSPSPGLELNPWGVDA